MLAFTVFVVTVFLFGLVSHRLEKTVFTAPMVFTLTGLLLYFFLPGLMVWMYIWLIQMLWRVHPAAWMFLVMITVFNLTFDFVVMLGETPWSDVSKGSNLN